MGAEGPGWEPPGTSRPRERTWVRDTGQGGGGGGRAASGHLGAGLNAARVTPGWLGMQTLLKEGETGPEGAGGRRRLVAPDGPGDCDSPRLPRSETGFSRDVGRGWGKLARHPEASRPRGHHPTTAPALGGPRPPGSGDRQGPVTLLLLQKILPIVKQIKDAERPNPSHPHGPQVSPD